MVHVLCMFNFSPWMLVYVKLQLSTLKKTVERRKKPLIFQQEYFNNLDYQTESVNILEVKSSFFPTIWNISMNN